MSKFVRILVLVICVFCLAQGVFSATFTVTKTSDSNDGICDSDCSLREAVGAANNAAGDDIIAFDGTVFGSAQTITLTLGEIVATANGSLTINGTGASMLTISGNNTSRILASSPNAVVNIDGIKFTAGTGAGAVNTGRGGAIYNVGGTIVINNSIITGNTAANGGGLNNAASAAPSPVVPANLTLNNCIVSNNTSTGSGGGMQNFSTSTVTINNSLFIGNTSGGTTGGGGAQFNGGVRITNTTFANNNAPGGSGGGFQSNGTLGTILTNVTVVGNTSTNNGGGIHRATTNVNFFIRNSIIAGNNGTAASPDVTNSANGIDSEGNNIIGNVGTSTGWEMSDLLNTNPMLNPLADNGGFSMTFLPMPGSPAINAGQNCVLDMSCATNNAPVNLTTDQRGVSRPQGMTVDIGAVEVSAMPTNASISGKILAPNGQGIGRAIVTISNMSGLVQTATTNSFGNYSFTDIPTGQMYTIDVLTKQYTFTPQNINLTGDVTGLNITASSGNLKK